jgi:hypothetical protein
MLMVKMIRMRKKTTVLFVATYWNCSCVCTTGNYHIHA